MRSRTCKRVQDHENTIVVTDLDGTLLDFDSYSFEEALPAIKALKRLRVPIVCCSSKTREEIEYWRRRIQLNSPLICENGAAVFMPVGMFKKSLPGLKRNGEYYVAEFGVPSKKLRKVFTDVRNRTGISIEGFSDMDVKKVQELCDFDSIGQARKAAAREYSEPFIFPDGTKPKTIELVLRKLRNEGHHVIRGKRFYHLIGDTDKGRAVEYLRDIYSRLRGSEPEVVGLGDSTNDRELLKVADYPVLVMGNNKRYNREIKSEINPILAGAPGPKGWNKAIYRLFNLKG